MNSDDLQSEYLPLYTAEKDENDFCARKPTNKNAELRILFEELNYDHSRRLYNLTKYQVERKRRRGIWSRVKKDFKKETISIILSGIISMTKQCRNKGVGYRD